MSVIDRSRVHEQRIHPVVVIKTKEPLHIHPGFFLGLDRMRGMHVGEFLFESEVTLQQLIVLARRCLRHSERIEWVGFTHETIEVGFEGAAVFAVSPDRIQLGRDITFRTGLEVAEEVIEIAEKRFGIHHDPDGITVRQ